jgi:signal transduction histidine kinase
MAEPSARDPRAGARSWVFDGVVALLLTALGLAILVSITDRRSFEALPLAVGLLVVHTGCIAWRRRAPLAVLVVNLGAGAGFCALGLPNVALGVATPVALYGVAAYTERRVSLGALGVTTVAMAAVLTLTPSESDASTVAGNAIALGVVWFLGDGQRARRAYVDELEQRTAELEAAREELARQAVARERLRIARELHDVVGHSMGMIAVQAGVGAHVIETRPDEARRSLEVIESASKSALSEIRRMLGLLRAPGDPTEIAPSPGVDDLPRLADEIRDTGLAVDLRVDEPSDPLPPGLDLTIFRLVQEALTNVVRHARASRVRVSVWFPDATARVEVLDDGSMRPQADGGGHGILGMRERVTMHGGKLETAPLPEGGFRVSAELPRDGGRS